jgi:hypothetical protein
MELHIETRASSVIEAAPERLPAFTVTISRGMQNVFGSDPPFVVGNHVDQSLGTIKGRF